MQTGYIFLCENEAIAECVKSKKFSCSDNQLGSSKIEENDVVFLFNSKTGTLIGPFTVGQPGEDLEKGGLYSYAQKNRLSQNIMVTWENLHKLDNAADKLPFLKDIKTCPLSALWTQELLDEIVKAPLYA